MDYQLHGQGLTQRPGPMRTGRRRTAGFYRRRNSSRRRTSGPPRRPPPPRRPLPRRHRRYTGGFKSFMKGVK